MTGGVTRASTCRHYATNAAFQIDEPVVSEPAHRFAASASSAIMSAVARGRRQTRTGAFHRPASRRRPDGPPLLVLYRHMSCRSPARARTRLSTGQVHHAIDDHRRDLEVLDAGIERPGLFERRHVPRVIWVSGEKRCAPASRPKTRHSPSAFGSGAEVAAASTSPASASFSFIG